MSRAQANSQKRILVVDDEPSILRVIGAFLRDENYAPTFAHNGVQGLQCFAQQGFDLVITDRHMPEMNGEQLAAAIRTLSPRIPIILISGQTWDFQGIHHSQFTAFLPKPFGRAHLLATIHKAVNSSADGEKAA